MTIPGSRSWLALLPIFAVLGALALAGCADRQLDATGSVAGADCPTLGVLPDGPNEFELQWGATNSNAALGHGGLTATMSLCGELSSLKWPGPSYYDQLDYLAENAPDARLKRHFGALESAGAFPGIAYRTTDGPGFTWLRDRPWTHAQRYASETSDRVITEMQNAELGLTVLAETFLLPERSVLVNHYEVTRSARSPVEEASLVFYENLAPTLARQPYFHLADWALDFQNDYAVVYDSREEALLHFLPEEAAGFPHDFAPLNPLLREPPSDRQQLQQAVDGLIGGLDDRGVYIAVGARGGDDGHQCGFDATEICAFQSELAERTIAVFDLDPVFADVARSLFQCSRVVPHPDGPLGACRDANGWTYDAESAYTDAADGTLSGSPLAACQANGALASRLQFGANGRAAATFDLAIGGTRDEAYALLREARRGEVAAQRASIDELWARFLAPARLPRTDDAEVLRFARRSLMVLRTSTDEASGAIVASVNAQPPYGADWPRDGAFLNVALDLAGYPEMVSRHNRFYARVQRKTPGPWSILYTFGPCDPARPTYPECVPAGTFEMNYYADPDEIIPAMSISFEIDEAGLGAWSMWDHARYLADPLERSAYLDEVCPSIELAARNLAECRDAATGLQCFANEDDNIPLRQTLQGAETVLLALKAGIDAASDCGFADGDVASWQARAHELGSAIQTHFLESDPVPHLAGPRPAWVIWPVGFLAADDPLAVSHAQVLRANGVDPVLERSAPTLAYNSEPLLALTILARERGDERMLGELRDAVRFFIRNLTTPGTGLMSEGQGRVDVDLNGDGLAPDYWSQNDIPHAWEHAYLYAAAMVAFGGTETPDGAPAPPVLR